MAVLGTAALATGLVVTPDLHGLPTESMLFMALVVATALTGGLLPALLGAVLASLLLNYLFVSPTGTLTIANPENAVALVVFLVTGVAVATVVDRAARRTAQAVRARSEANALAVLSHALLHTGDDQVELLGKVCEVFSMTGAAVLRRSEDGWTVEASHGDAPTTVADSDADIVVSPEVSVVLRGHPLDAADQRLMSAYAAHFAVVRERREALAESRHAAELAEGNRTRTALLAAVSHDLRTPLAAIKAAVSSLRDPSVHWSPPDEAELLATDCREALFAPFQRLGDVPNGDGLGLGLAVARGLAEAMHGRLDARDTPGGGLTMVIDLPTASPAPAAVDLDPPPPRAAVPSPTAVTP